MHKMSRLHIIYTEIVLYHCIVLYCKCKKADIKVWLKLNEWGKENRGRGAISPLQKYLCYPAYLRHIEKKCSKAAA